MHDESTEWGLGTTTQKNHLNGNLGAKISTFSKEEVRIGLRRKIYSLKFFSKISSVNKFQTFGSLFRLQSGLV